MPKTETKKAIKKRFLLWTVTIIALMMLYPPIRSLLTTSARKAYYLYILIIPLMSGYLFYRERRILFSNSGHSRVGAIIMAVGLMLYFLRGNYAAHLNPDDYSSVSVFSVFVFWVGAFVLCFGYEKIKKEAFPFLFLLLMIPIPSYLFERLIGFIQQASVETTYRLFQVMGFPVLKEGFVFHLNAVAVEVAEECSGIRTTIALFIIGLLAADLFLKTRWKKGVLVLSSLLIAILKNAIRIITLTLLGAYVDVKLINRSFLHHPGGFIFFLFALVLLWGVLWILRRSEKSQEV
jgi:exosortase